MRYIRRLRRAQPVLAAFFILFSPALHGATIVVDETTCTLINAIEAANADGPSGGCPAGSGADTIDLTTNVTLTGVYFLEDGLPRVDSEITVEGGGFVVERAVGAPDFRIFHVVENGVLELNDVQILNGGEVSSGANVYNIGGILRISDSTVAFGTASTFGSVISAGTNTSETVISLSTVSNNMGVAIVNAGAMTIDQSTISDNLAFGDGAGISNGGVLEIVNSTIRNNVIIGDGGGIENRGTLTLTDSAVLQNETSTGSGEGGGILNKAGGVVVVSNSSVSENSAGEGAGIWNAGSLTVNASMVTGNQAGTVGGGIYVPGGFPGTVTELTDSTVAGNSSDGLRGGGIYVSSTPLTVTRCTISGNSAIQEGGGIYAFSSFSQNFVVINSTISGNSAGEEGSGLFVIGGARMVVTNSTIVGNQNAGSAVWNQGALLALANSIVADNPGGNCSGFEPITDQGNNFADDASCAPGFSGITPGVDFDTFLADNGGPTRTHALLTRSVAVDAAGDCGLPTDQRGVPRDDGSCDSGSFEFQAGAGTPASSSVGVLVAIALVMVLSWVILRWNPRASH